MTSTAVQTVLEIDRADHGNTRLTQEPVAELTSGQVRLRIDSFALTANNITYAVAGDMLGYWDFFPGSTDQAGRSWGRVPAMGWAEVVESANPEVPVGGRYYGWFPMASHLTLDVGATPDGFRDDGAHRQAHAAVYRGYVATERDPWYDGEGEGESRHALLRGLFITGFLAEEFFADANYFDAEQVVVMSASSKTAIGFAQRVSERGSVKAVGVTSARNVEFVQSLGYYDSVITYDQVASIDQVPSVVIDMAGNSAALATVHERLDDHLAHSMMIGMSHHDAAPTTIAHGPTPQMFFAPGEIAARHEAWGRDEYNKRTTTALQDFVAASPAWLQVEATAGPNEAEAMWHAVRNGEVAPSTGCVTSLNAG